MFLFLEGHELRLFEQWHQIQLADVFFLNVMVPVVSTIPDKARIVVVFPAPFAPKLQQFHCRRLQNLFRVVPLFAHTML